MATSIWESEPITTHQRLQSVSRRADGLLLPSTRRFHKETPGFTATHWESWWLRVEFSFFGPSLSALPAIVTFDVVDMGNEGECEQQTELVEEEEELASPYEPFEDDGCYLQQDAFAECDQRTFDAYEQSLLLSTLGALLAFLATSVWGRLVHLFPAPLALKPSQSLTWHGTVWSFRRVSFTPLWPAFSQRRTADCRDTALPRQPCRSLLIVGGGAMGGILSPPTLLSKKPSCHMWANQL